MFPPASNSFGTVRTMARPPAARDKVLQAFAELVAAEGEQVATLDAVAERAGVSKGGLLYHFGSREALLDGLLEKLLAYGEEDLQQMAADPDGPVTYYLRTSARSPGGFNDFYLAASRISGPNAERARGALMQLERGWYDALLEATGDPAVATTLLLLGDGLYLKALRGQQDLAVENWKQIEPLITQWVGERD
ncbi:regulatory TetR family protein [Naumannella halotolerans]|uniref:Regulatory TetR family protein n=2 Tax=Naumannella halotolerans TaxID=993414 RepID=A0A4R7J5X9_9ACTN|nr:regulatory TetR family protein [Naumannella halotolerans]